MTKNELMDLSRECGLEFCEEESAHSVFVSLAQLYNAILERTALKLDAMEENGKTPWAFRYPSDEVRSLKLPTN